MQHLGLITILLLIAGLIFTVTKWPLGYDKTFSQHAAENRWSKVFYSLLFMTCLPLLMLFFTAWLVPTKGLPDIFLWFAAIAVIFQIVCTWIPEVGGKRTIIHRILTGISGIALLPLFTIIATTSHLSGLVRGISGAALVVMTILLAIALKNQKGYRYALLLQVGYYALFFVVILVATYL